MPSRLRSILLLVLVVLPGTAVPAAISDIQRWTTGNGATVYFLPTSHLPMVDAWLVFDAGAARDGGHPGLARLTNTLLLSGTESLSPDAVAKRFDAVGAQVRNGAMRDMAWVSLRSLSARRYLDPALQTLGEILHAPAFAPDSLSRERGRMLAALQGRRQSPSDVAEDAFYRALYRDHPYGSPPAGTDAGLAGIDRPRVRGFYRRHYVAANASLAIVGDLDREGAEALALELTGSLPRGERAPALPPAPSGGEALVMRIPFPSSQSHVYIGQTGIRRLDPDFYRLYLGNHILGGGGLVSLLFQEVRERRGLSYGVSSHFQTMRVAGPFAISAQTRNDQADEAAALIHRTVRGFLARGPDAEAFAEARDNLVGSFALRIDSNRDLVTKLAGMAFYGQPSDYLARFRERIEGLTREEVTDALRRHLDPERMVTVIVGGG